MLHEIKYPRTVAAAFFLFACLLGSLPELRSQEVTRVAIENADLLRVDNVKGGSVRKLIGNAILRQDNTLFYCDTAILDFENNLRAIGNVHINYDDSVHVYGDYLFYNGNTRIAILDSNVTMTDQHATLYTDHLEYDRKQAIAYYFTGGRIISEDNVLTSRTGYYYTRLKEFFFKDSVVVVNPDYTMYADTMQYNTETEIVYIEGPTDIIGKENHIYSERGWYDTRTNRSELTKNNRITHLEQILKGDWIYYDREREYGKALGNVWMKDTIQDMIVEGGVSEFFRKERYSYLTDSARAILIENMDTLFMHADSFIMVLDTADKAKTIFAYHRMKFFRDDLQGMSDSLVYRVQDSVIAMLKNPVLWSDENQLTADSIWIHLSQNRIDSLVLFNMAFIISRDSTNTFNQIKGKHMTAYFHDNQLYRIKVEGNAETLYFVREDSNELIGINKSISSSMIIKVTDNKIRDTYYTGQPDAALHPEGELPESDLILRDFIWMENHRPPDKSAIFIWRLDGSEY
jgi:lipopolysaccharide export system protein LptA